MKHRLIQITDPHIGENADYRLLGLDTGSSLDQVLSALIREPVAAQLLVTTGDIAANGVKNAYLRFTKKMESLPMPWLWLPGNHDDPGQMKQLAPQRHPEVAFLGNWRLILLDTSLPKRTDGGLDQQQLHRLQILLAEHHNHPVLIFMHHPPVATGSTWADTIMLRQGREKFLQLVLNAKNVRAMSWGHVHQQFDSRLEYIDLYATPSTSIQFTPGSRSFAADTALPGYRWFDLCDDGSYQTGVERVAISDYSVDFSSSGY